MDVLIAYWLTSHVFWAYHQMFEMPKKDRPDAPMSRLWLVYFCRQFSRMSVPWVHVYLAAHCLFHRKSRLRFLSKFEKCIATLAWARWTVVGWMRHLLSREKKLQFSKERVHFFLLVGGRDHILEWRNSKSEVSLYKKEEHFHHFSMLIFVPVMNVPDSPVIKHFWCTTQLSSLLLNLRRSLGSFFLIVIDKLCCFV